MITKITSEEYPEIWQLITDDVYEESHREHRKQSNFFVKWVYKIDESLLPDRPELWGFWESNTLIHDTEYGLDERPSSLFRVEQFEKVTVSREWRHVG